MPVIVVVIMVVIVIVTVVVIMAVVMIVRVIMVMAIFVVKLDLLIPGLDGPVHVSQWDAVLLRHLRA